MRTGRYALVSLCAGLALVATGALRADERDLRVVQAVKQRDQRMFNELLRAKADVNSAEADGATALAWAVHLGQGEMVEALLRVGVNVNATDVYGDTALTLAAANGDGALISSLLAAGAAAGTKRWNGETALMLAAGAGSLEGVKALIEHGADVNEAEPRLGQTPLMWAAAEGHGDVVQGLLAAGANVNLPSSSGSTPVAFASAKGDVRSIETLLAAGADPNQAMPSGTRPLMIALSNRHADAALALLAGGARADAGDDRTGSTPLHVAAQSGSLPAVKALLARKVDVNARTAAVGAAGGARGGGGFFRAPNGAMTPLMLAASGGHPDVMRALVEAGADPSLRSENGSNLVMLAAGAAKVDTVKYAYELDPKVDIVLPGGSTIMHLAVGLGGRTQQEVCEVIQFLADQGAPLDEANDAGRTPIAQADVIPVDLASNLLGKLIRARGGVPKIEPKYPAE
jgi:ankyrin repeat protein